MVSVFFGLMSAACLEIEGDDYLIASVKDITERKQIEESLENRIAVLTSPSGYADSISFNDLFSLDEIQKLQDDFSAATGVASLITQADGTPITAPSNFAGLCKDIIRGNATGNANCLKSDTALGEMNTDERESSLASVVASGMPGLAFPSGASISRIGLSAR